VCRSDTGQRVSLALGPFDGGYETDDELLSVEVVAGPGGG
jgi:hypothetical protein